LYWRIELASWNLNRIYIQVGIQNKLCWLYKLWWGASN